MFFFIIFTQHEKFETPNDVLLMERQPLYNLYKLSRVQ